MCCGWYLMEESSSEECLMDISDDEECVYLSSYRILHEAVNVEPTVVRPPD